MWQRVGFRFFFIYLLLQAAPWMWLARIPVAGELLSPIGQAVDWLVRASNTSLFRVRPELVAPNGSGDTSWAWTQLWLYLSIAAAGTVVWTLLDRRRLACPKLLYGLRTVLRYYLAMYALSYGFIKLFMLQMGFPTESNLATPLGDYLPMRFSWLFIGYSGPYQFFSGAAETAAGLLLLWRPTVTLGLLAAAGAFLNVVMINLAYDVPVKLFASHLFFASLFLLALDAPRLLNFFVLNRGAPATNAWNPPFSGRGWRIARLVAKGYFLVFMLAMPLSNGWSSYQARKITRIPVPFSVGKYDVRTFVRNGDTVAFSPGDTTRWADFIVDGASGNSISGSAGTTDTLFWQRYRRGYFRLSADTLASTLSFWRSSFRFDSTHLFNARYEKPDSLTIRMWAQIRGDSIAMELVKVRRHYQLTERQFHWLSEYNR